jgi:hypothetical protein
LLTAAEAAVARTRAVMAEVVLLRRMVSMAAARVVKVLIVSRFHTFVLFADSLAR